MKRINVGLVGCGRIMPAHLRGYRILQDKGIEVRIKALCARKIDDALRYRSQDEGASTWNPTGPEGDPLKISPIYVYDFQKDTEVEPYDDYKKMLRKADIDAVDIYTPHFVHHNVSIAASEAGMHVMVEKPMAITIKAGWKMIEAASKAGKTLAVAENAHYNRGNRIAKWIVDRGYIGDVHLIAFAILGGHWSPNQIVAQTDWRHNRLKAGGGAAIDFGVHAFHGMQYIMGEIEEVSSIAKIFEKERVTLEDNKVKKRISVTADDSYFCLLKFKNGSSGFTAFSYALHGEPTSLEGGRVIYGSKGCLKRDYVILDDGTRYRMDELFQREASNEDKADLFPLGITDTFALETYDWIQSIWEEREPTVSGRTGLNDLACGYAVLESSYINRPVKITDLLSGAVDQYQKEINIQYGL